MLKNMPLFMVHIKHIIKNLILLNMLNIGLRLDIPKKLRLKKLNII